MIPGTTSWVYNTHCVLLIPKRVCSLIIVIIVHKCRPMGQMDRGGRYKWQLHTKETLHRICNVIYVYKKKTTNNYLSRNVYSARKKRTRVYDFSKGIIEIVVCNPNLNIWLINTNYLQSVSQNYIIN